MRNILLCNPEDNFTIVGVIEDLTIQITYPRISYNSHTIRDKGSISGTLILKCLSLKEDYLQSPLDIHIIFWKDGQYYTDYISGVELLNDGWEPSWNDIKIGERYNYLCRKIYHNPNDYFKDYFSRGEK